MNDFFVDGNLTREPELRTTNSGKTVISFSIAHNKRVKKGDNWEDQPHFYDVEYWTEKPQYWLQKLTKGAGVTLHCEALQDRWEKEGVKHSRIKFSCVEPPKLLSRGDLSTKPSGQSEPGQDAVPYNPMDDDIPFN